MTTRPVLYIDIDGVIFARYGYRDWIQLRPDAMGFLLWATENFNCRWLTCWSEAQIDGLVNHTYVPPAIRAIVYTHWDRGNKSTGVDLVADFYWIEDGLSQAEYGALHEAGKSGRYIPVNPNGEHGLRDAWAALRSRLEERKATEKIDTLTSGRTGFVPLKGRWL